MANKETPISLRARNIAIAWWCGEFFSTSSLSSTLFDSVVVCLWQQFTLFIYSPPQWTTCTLSRPHVRHDEIAKLIFALIFANRRVSFSRFSPPMSLLGVQFWSMKCTTVDGAHVLLSNTKATLLFHLCVSLIRNYYTRCGVRFRSLVQCSGIYIYSIRFALSTCSPHQRCDLMECPRNRHTFGRVCRRHDYARECNQRHVPNHYATHTPRTNTSPILRECMNDFRRSTGCPRK